jgi:capsular exopolysaccharide synthesis family protein
MTLSDYLKVFRRRWLVIAVCTLAAAGVMWAVTPAHPDASQKASSYTATATLLVGTDAADAPLGRIALYLRTGEIPRRAAARLGYQGDPAVLVSRLTVTPDSEAAALTVSATEVDGAQAAAVANAFADETVAFFERRQPGTGTVSVSILQGATPIPNAAGGFLVVPPSRNARTALAGGLGLLLGLGLALVLDRFDFRLRTRDEIASALRLPVIAEVPKLNRARRRRRAIGVADEPLSRYADSYRSARTAIAHTASQLVTEEGSPRPSQSRGLDSSSAASLVLVTSAYPGEGKSTSVANLAASFAETGQRVLVLDADLRSPDTHNLFDVPQGAGISDYLTGPDDASLEALARPTSIPGVRIITAGTRLEHPASLASRMGGLLIEAREMADVVLIETAPLLAASDVFDILPSADTVLVVARPGRITEVAGQRVSELLGRFQVPVSGVVIVGAKPRRSDPSGYNYGYSYGYGRHKKRQRPVSQPRAAATAARPDSSSEPALEGRNGRHATRHGDRRRSSA